MIRMLISKVPSITLKAHTPLYNSFTTYTHTQLQSAEVWTIHHNLRCFPSVTVVDSGGNTVIGDVIHVNDTLVELRFTSPFSGKAYLN
jgi:hypothetical protein